MDKVCFRRLRWNSRWMLLGIPGTAYGLWCLLPQFWHGFHAIATLMGLLCLLAFGPCVWYGLQTVHITAQAVTLKLGPVVLRQMPVSHIHTVTSVSVGLVKGNSFYEQLIILSPRRLEEMIFVPSENPRGALHQYFDGKMKHIHLPASEGIWLQYTDDEIANRFPCAENFILKPEKPDQGGVRHG